MAIPGKVSFGIVPPHVCDDMCVPHFEELFFLVGNVFVFVFSNAKQSKVKQRSKVKESKGFEWYRLGPGLGRSGQG